MRRRGSEVDPGSRPSAREDGVDKAVKPRPEKKMLNLRLATNSVRTEFGARRIPPPAQSGTALGSGDIQDWISVLVSVFVEFVRPARSCPLLVAGRLTRRMRREPHRDEVRDVGCDPFGALPVRAMSCFLVDLEPRRGHGCEEGILLGARKQRVVIAPQ